MEDIRKFNVWKLLIYFILYSVAGFFIETIYAIFTKGMLESRKSFLYGPFCSIYGIAAVAMIYTLQQHKKNPFKIYFLGSVIGLAIEYIFSFLGEVLFHARWWDYSNNFGNLNGRICVFYALIWGFLSLILIYVITPKTEKVFQFLEIKTSVIVKFTKLLIIIMMIFIIMNSIITSYAVKNFINNVSKMYGIEIRGLENEYYKENVFTRYFSNEKMIMIYPNISVITTNNEVVYLGSVLQQYKNYYYCFKNIRE